MSDAKRFQERCMLLIVEPLDHFATGSRTHCPKTAPLLSVARDTADEVDRAVGKQQIHASRMVAGEIIEAAIGVGADVNPVVVYQDQRCG
jgi:hypothetical protein